MRLKDLRVGEVYALVGRFDKIKVRLLSTTSYSYPAHGSATPRERPNSRPGRKDAYGTRVGLLALAPDHGQDSDNPATDEWAALTAEEAIARQAELRERGLRLVLVYPAELHPPTYLEELRRQREDEAKQARERYAEQDRIQARKTELARRVAEAIGTDEAGWFEFINLSVDVLERLVATLDAGYAAQQQARPGRTLHVVASGEYSDYRVHAVTATEELAADLVRRFNEVLTWGSDRWEVDGALPYYDAAPQVELVGEGCAARVEVRHHDVPRDAV